MNAVLKVISAMSKVFLDTGPDACDEAERFEGFENELISFQAAYCLTDVPNYSAFVQLRIESPIQTCIRVRRVLHVPVHFAAPEDADDDYLRKTPGLYPDLLRDLDKTRLRGASRQWHSLWLDVEGAPAGIHPVTLILSDNEGGTLCTAETKVHVLAGRLPAAAVRHTKWFHGDGLAQYYHAGMWSEEYWQICERFLAHAVRRGINTTLVPVHTPPLDTRQGQERLTCQLVDIALLQGEYHFDFTRLRRYIAMCRRCGVEYYEMAHLFTQWGALHAPKIEADADGCPARLFGWETDAQSESYRSFLAAYLPALTKELHALGIAEKVYFHISDEPSEAQIPAYLAAKRLAAPYLKGFKILDAISDPALYEQDQDVIPVPASNYIKPFLSMQLKERWVYYCCGQYRGVSNLFIAMPSSRNRILGVQMYVNQMQGFLHWGYNFYNSQYSDYAVDPYACTDGDYFGPAGDPFQVYPGQDGIPEDSIRMMVSQKAFEDLRALQWLETLKGRGFVMDLIRQCAGMDLSAFDVYPRDTAFLPLLRQCVNRSILAAADQ